jgi:cob(I)alamin adenosyltransferase
MVIYTKTGDSGTTGTFKGCRINKDTPLMEAIGTVDELNSLLGVVLCLPHTQLSNDLFNLLISIQKDLFVMGSLLSGSSGEFRLQPTDFEKEIDLMWKKLPPLKNFILPGGTSLAANLFIARAVCRRAERRVIALKKFPQIVPYLNRLSDYLFVLARYLNFLEKKEEIVWIGNP